jgi:integrase
MGRASSSWDQRGNVRRRGKSFQVRVFAGTDPVTGKPVYFTESTTDEAQVDTILTKLLRRADEQRSPGSAVTLGYAINEWIRVSELEDSTRYTYEGYIDRTIRPTLGGVPVNKINARTLENFYADLRRCRKLCDRKPFIDKHATTGDHDCAAEQCQPHVCKPMAASTIRQLHAIISGTLSAAERWDWITANPARSAKRPKQKPPQPDPPSPKDAAKLAEEAFRMDDDWGTLVWLVMTTGIRRGEVCALRFYDLEIDFDDEAGDNEGVLEVRRNYVYRNGVGKEKDTKTHQMRRIALDRETVALLCEHRDRVKDRLSGLDQKFSDELYVFSASATPDHSRPYSPNAVTQRYKDMADRLGIDTHIHALRHYSATELLTAGVDLRTVAGRLGHGGGGSTTLRVYAAWVAASDRKAAETLPHA